MYSVVSGKRSSVRRLIAMLQRIITGLLLLAIGIYVIINGGIPYLAFMVISSVMVNFELQKMISDKNIALRTGIGTVLLGIAFGLTQTQEGIQLWNSKGVMLITLTVVSIGVLELFLKRLVGQGSLVFATVRATLLTVFTTPYLALIRTESAVPMFFICIMIWMSDMGAYFGGRFLGKTPLSELSPKKTVEGSLFGLLAGFIGANIFLNNIALELPYLWLTVFGVIILGQMGDLHESLTKRFYCVKDSSNYIPGHGGFYDRMDSFVLSLPIFYYWIYVI